MSRHHFYQKKCKHVWMRLKLDFHNCWSRDIALALHLIMTLVLISFCSFFLCLACDYSYTINSIIAWDNVLLNWRITWRWAEVFRPKRCAIKKTHNRYIEKLSSTFLHLTDFYMFNQVDRFICFSYIAT